MINLTVLEPILEAEIPRHFWENIGQMKFINDNAAQTADKTPDGKLM